MVVRALTRPWMVGEAGMWAKIIRLSDNGTVRAAAILRRNDFFADLWIELSPNTIGLFRPVGEGVRRQEIAALSGPTADHLNRLPNCSEFEYMPNHMGGAHMTGFAVGVRGVGRLDLDDCRVKIMEAMNGLAANILANPCNYEGYGFPQG